ncbi:hypothetical protein R2362_16045 [Mycobacteroides chelonae]|nr:hypothetical protein [Mycobacteroides chelonae]
MLTPPPLHDPLLRAVIDEAGLTMTCNLWRQGEPAMFHSTPTSHADIDHRFNYHRPDVDQVTRHESIRGKCKDLAHDLDSILPPGREKALALTKLEEALMWGNAAIAREVLREPIANAHQSVIQDHHA